MEEIIFTIVLQAIATAIERAVEKGITYIIKKVVDSAGNVITQIVYEYDSDGDGVNDSEEVIYTLDVMIPDLKDGYCLCNKGNEIGLGLPQYKVIDGLEISNLIDTDIITGNDNGFIVDIDFDGENDDILIPLPDFSGDGYDDWGQLIDDDNNGLPDVSPFTPFYPVGSEEYTYIVEQSGADDTPIMEKPIDNYNVTEGLLALLVLFTVLKFVWGLFTRKDVLR